MFNLNLGNVGQALQATGSNYKLPEGMAQPTQAPALSMPSGVNDALAVTGSEYRAPVANPAGEMPGWVDSAQEATKVADALPEPGSAESRGEKQNPGLKNSPVMGLAKKVVGAVAAFYTGGLSSAAMNVGGQVLSKNNPQAGQAAGAVSSFL